MDEVAWFFFFVYGFSMLMMWDCTSLTGSTSVNEPSDV